MILIEVNDRFPAKLKRGREAVRRELCWMAPLLASTLVLAPFVFVAFSKGSEWKA